MNSKNTTNSLLVASITLNLASNEPLYQQLFHQLLQLILGGRLPASTRLPSSRQLALDLKVSRTTSINAYQQLQAQGFLISQQGSGVYVNANLPSATLDLNQTNNNTHPARTTPVEEKPPLVSFNSGPDVANFPFPLWAKCLSKAWRKPEPSLLHDIHLGGYHGLRVTLSQYLYTMRGIDCNPRQIVITAGQRDSLSLLSRALLKQGDTALMENPGYPLQRQVIKSLGLKQRLLEVDDQGAQLPNQAGANSKLAILGPNRQYPLGISMSGPRKLAWLNHAQNHNCWIVEDDYDSEFTYEKHKTDALMSLDKNQQVILLGSFSKLMFQGFRLGYLVLPEPIIDKVLAAQQDLGNMASLHIQPALSLFLSDRNFTSHLGRMRRLYRHRRDELCRLINLHLSQWLYASPPDSGMHLVAFSHRPIDDQAIAQRLATLGIKATALSSHYADGGPSGFCLGFSGCNDAELRRNVELLRKELDTQAPTQSVGTRVIGLN